MKKPLPLPVEEWHKSQRGYFAGALYNQMLLNDRIWLITGDLGYGMFDKIREQFPDRFLNTGAAEQSMMGIGVGLAMEGRIPFVYSITPFLLWRTAETIRNYISREQIPVKLIGGGRDHDYAHDGFSHYAGDDKELLRLWPNILTSWPDEKEHIPELLDEVVMHEKPYYINLKR